MKFQIELELSQFVLPAFCSGILFIGLVLFSYTFKRYWKNLYFSMLVLGLFAFIFVFSELMIVLEGGWLYNASLGMQFHRLEQIAGAYFLFGVPCFMSYLLLLTPAWNRANRVIAVISLAIAVIITFIAFIEPDLFISQTQHKKDWLIMAANYGRGAEGIVYTIRDILLCIMIIYAVACFIADLKLHKRYEFLLLPFIGILAAMFGGVNDMIYIYTGIQLDQLQSLNFSRFSLGITFFIISSMASITKKFFDQAKDVEKAFGALNASEERFRQLAEHINEAFFICDYNSGEVQYISPAYEKIWGVPGVSIFSTHSGWIDSVHREDRKTVLEAFSMDSMSERFELEYRIIRPDKYVCWVRDQVFIIKNDRGERIRLARIIEDITERKHSEIELVFMAYHDILTGLPNKRSFFDKLNDLILQVSREDNVKNKAVLFIDLSGFNDVNEMHGHVYGDKVLREVADRLKAAIRESDYLFRFGGDEFTIVLNSIADDLDAAFVAKKLIDRVSTPYSIEGKEVFVSIRIGISIYPKDGKKAELLVKNADIAIHEIKSETNIYKFYDPAMNSKAFEKLTIRNYLRNAVEKNQFALYYQPIVDCEHGIAGMEALIRWIHPDLGFVPPDKFIHIAETSGVIIDIGEWTLITACRQIKEWIDEGYKDLRVAVNLSAQQFKDDKLVDKVMWIMEKNGLNPRALKLEITESCVMENPELTVKKINQLHEAGIGFSIDDFGTGYSSLSYLKRFKIEHLKVDRSFVKDIMVDESNTEITKAIIAMAHSLSMKVIAEGVETPDQIGFLKNLNCEYLQGYYFSKPVPASDFSALLKKGFAR